MAECSHPPPQHRCSMWKLHLLHPSVIDIRLTARQDRSALKHTVLGLPVALILITCLSRVTNVQFSQRCHTYTRTRTRTCAHTHMPGAGKLLRGSHLPLTWRALSVLLIMSFKLCGTLLQCTGQIHCGLSCAASLSLDGQHSACVAAVTARYLLVTRALAAAQKTGLLNVSYCERHGWKDKAEKKKKYEFEQAGSGSFTSSYWACVIVDQLSKSCCRSEPVLTPQHGGGRSPLFCI